MIKVVVLTSIRKKKNKIENENKTIKSPLA
jgi:hypothetical protein